MDVSYIFAIRCGSSLLTQVAKAAFAVVTVVDISSMRCDSTEGMRCRLFEMTRRLVRQ